MRQPTTQSRPCQGNMRKHTRHVCVNDRSTTGQWHIYAETEHDNTNTQQCFIIRQMSIAATVHMLQYNARCCLKEQLLCCHAGKANNIHVPCGSTTSTCHTAAHALAGCRYTCGQAAGVHKVPAHTHRRAWQQRCSGTSAVEHTNPPITFAAGQRKTASLCDPLPCTCSTYGPR